MAHFANAAMSLADRVGRKPPYVAAHARGWRASAQKAFPRNQPGLLKGFRALGASGVPSPKTSRATHRKDPRKFLRIVCRLADVDWEIALA
eukprot:8713196-Pyramimonas_sp.AAC.1